MNKTRLFSFSSTLILLLGLGYIIFIVDWQREDKLTGGQTLNEIEVDQSNSKTNGKEGADIGDIDVLKPTSPLDTFDPKTYDIESIIKLAVQTHDQHGFESFQQILKSFQSDKFSSYFNPIKVLPEQSLINLISHIYASKSVSAVGFTDTFEKTMEFSGHSRKHMLMSLIDQWTDVEPREAYLTVSLIEPTNFRLWLQYIVLKQWGKKQPRIVMEDLMSFDRRIGWVAEREAMLAIARETPSEASIYFERGKLSGLELDLVVEIAKSWTKQDPESAFDWIVNEENITEFARESGLSMALVTLACLDPRDALQRALGLKEQTNLGIQYHQQVMKRIASDNSNLALDLLNEITDDEHTVALAIVVGSQLIMEKKFDLAQSVGDTLPPHDKQQYQGSILGTWATQDPIHLLQNIPDLPETLVPLAAQTLLLQNAFGQWFQFLDDATVSDLESKVSSDVIDVIEKMQYDSANPFEHDDDPPAFKGYSITEVSQILYMDYLYESGAVYSLWLLNAPGLHAP